MKSPPQFSPPELVVVKQKRLVGMSIQLSLANDLTKDLFKRFMPRRIELQGIDLSRVYDLKLYPSGYFQNFDPTKNYVKWAAAESTGKIPEGMDEFILEGGNYACFNVPKPDKSAAIFSYIYSEWLPQSSFQIDNRPHFDVLPLEPGSGFEIYIPVKN